MSEQSNTEQCNCGIFSVVNKLQQVIFLQDAWRIRRAVYDVCGHIVLLCVNWQE